MNNNSDPLFDRYAELDFSDAKPVSEIPALAQLQAEHGIKDTKPIQSAQLIDRDILDTFRTFGNDWQVRMNDALREWLREHAV